MTSASGSRPVGEDPDDTGRLHQLRMELARWGIVIEDPAEGAPVSVLHLAGAGCEIDPRGAGGLALTYLPLGRDLRPHEAVWLALAVLDGNGPPGPGAAVVPERGLPLEDAAGRVLAARGMAAENGEAGPGDGEVTAALLVSNPADRARGRVTVSGRRGFLWECRFAGPGSPVPGLPPFGIARAIAAALAGTAREPRGAACAGRRSRWTAAVMRPC
jgi:hypothetical protein